MALQTQNSFIAIDVQGADELAAKLEKMPDAVADAATEAVADYIIKKLEAYPPRKSITRKQGFPHLFAVTPKNNIIRGYKSWKQFKYVMRLVHSGRVPYNRKQVLRNGWQKIGEGRKLIIANETDYAAFVQGSYDEQTRMMHLIGWERIDTVIGRNREKIDRVLFAAANKAIRKLGIEVEP